MQGGAKKSVKFFTLFSSYLIIKEMETQGKRELGQKMNVGFAQRH
jgi:hypothetical protein